MIDLRRKYVYGGMLLSTAIIFFFVFLFWIFIFISDFYLRQSNSERYIKFLDNYGISLTNFQLRLYLTNIDRQATYFSVFLQQFIKPYTLSPRKSRILALWFSLGAFISLMCFFITPIYLFRTFISELSSAFLPQSNPVFVSTASIISQQNFPPPLAANQHSFLYIPLHEHINACIIPIFPGINLPLTHMPIFLSVLIVASIIHEAGHAIAAANANVRVTGLGIFLFAIFPGAFTEVERNELDRCSYAQKLRIYGAGIWHNMILAIIGILILISIPLFSLPLYSSNAGVIVTDVDPKSGLFGLTGLQPGYHITHINQCEVQNVNDWAECFAKIRGNHTSGFLAQHRAVSRMKASKEYVFVHPDGEVQCCGEFNVTSSTHICFGYYALAPAKIQQSTIPPPTTPKPFFPNFPDFEAEFGLHPRRKRANLKMRLLPPITTNRGQEDAYGQPVWAKSPNRLPQSHQFSYACLPAMQIIEHAQCEMPMNSLQQKMTATLPPKDWICVAPALFNDTVLLRFQVKDHQKPVLFIGYLTEPLHAVDITELTPRFAFIPWWLPRIAELFGRYLITLSLAMAIFNAVPCYGLDGQFISHTVVDYFCQNGSFSFRKRVDKSIMICGTFIMCSNILIGFIKSFLAN